jgi:hypothetical protein
MDPRSPLADGRRRSTVFEANGDVVRASPQYRSISDRCATDAIDCTSYNDENYTVPTTATGKGILQFDPNSGRIESDTPEFGNPDKGVVKTNSRGFQYRSIAAEWNAEATKSGKNDKVTENATGAINGNANGNGKSTSTVSGKINTATDGNSSSTPPRTHKFSQRTSPYSLGLGPTSQLEESDKRRQRAIRFGLLNDAVREAVTKEDDEEHRRRQRALRFGLSTGPKEQGGKPEHKESNGRSLRAVASLGSGVFKASKKHRANKGGKRRYIPY